MLQNPCKTFGFKKNMVYKIPPGGGGKPYPASGLEGLVQYFSDVKNRYLIFTNVKTLYQFYTTNRVILRSYVCCVLKVLMFV